MVINNSSLGKINSRDAYVVESSASKSSLKETTEYLDEKLQNDCTSVLPVTSSVKFSNNCGSIVIKDHNYEVEHNHSSFDSYVPSDPIDIVQSGDSLIKFYNFNSSNCNSRTEKCIAFWRTVMANKSIKPVECVFKVSNSNISSDCEKSPNEEEDALKIHLEGTDIPPEWFDILVKMKKKKMDRLAVDATGAECKICNPKTAISKYKKKSNKYSKRDYEDIVCLNCWVPKSVKKGQVGDKRVSYVAKLHSPESLSSGSSKTASSGEMDCRCICSKCQCASITHKSSKKHKSGDEGSVCKCTCDPGQCECFCVTTGKEPQKLQPENVDDESVCKCDCEQGKCTCFCVVEDEPKAPQPEKIASYKGDEGSVCKCTCEQGECSCFCVVDEEPITPEQPPDDVESNCLCICEPGECKCTCAEERKSRKPEKILGVRLEILTGDEESVCKCSCAPGECTCSCVADLLKPEKEDEESVCKCTCAPGECSCSCVAELLKPEKIGDEESVCRCTCEPGECTCSCVADLLRTDEKGDEESVCKCTCEFGECTCSCVADIIESKETDEESVCKCTCEPGECTCSCLADLKLKKIGDEESVCKCTCESGECTCSCVTDSDISIGESECPICQKETCNCKQYFEEEAQEFVKQVLYELRHLRKDVGCSTEEQEKLRQKQSNKKFCSICEDKKKCEIMHKRVKELELIIPGKEEDIYFETLFQSLRHSDSLSTTLLPVTRKIRKSTAFFSRTRLSYFIKEFSERTSGSKTTDNTIKRKTFQKKRRLPKGNATATTSKMSSDESARVSQTQKIEKRSLLWYSTDARQNR